jgi:crotonobetainyl-CoA:carnitine CoA-transferase CaiB-like acyl-CoA transferase
VDLLEGVRVADFTHAFAGPTGTVMLALMGAEVIKIESSTYSDVASRDPKYAKAMENVGIFHCTNINKLSIRLNLKRQEAIDLAKRLVKISDIVVENFRPGVMEKLGLGYSALKRVKPDIIMVSLSSHGATGPEREFGAYAAQMGPLSGLSSVTGYRDCPPAPIRSTADTLAGVTTILPLLAALNYRRRSGKGQHIDSSAIESLSIGMSDIFMDYTMNKRVRNRDGNRHDFMAPHNCYACKGVDKWVSIAVATEEEWKAFCGAIGNPAWIKDEKFKDGLTRWENQEELDRLIGEWTRNYTSSEVMTILQKAGIAAVPSFTNKEIVEDPHCKERGVFAEVNQPHSGKQIQMRLPWKLSSAPQVPIRPVPLLGEHIDYVFGNLLGVSQEEIKRLEEEEVIL